MLRLAFAAPDIRIINSPQMEKIICQRKEAAKHHEAGSHEKAAHHAHVARGHVIHSRGHAEEAVKAHLEEHGKK